MLRPSLRLCTALFVLLVPGLLLPAASRADFVATTTLKGSGEVPPNASPATGTAVITYNAALNQLGYTVTFSNLSAPPSAGHIHVGSSSVAGPVILPFTIPGPPATSGTFSGILTAANLLPSPANGINTFADAVNAIVAGNTYVNLHDSPSFTGGEIRGQLALAAVPEPDMMASLAFCGLGLLGLTIRARKTRRIGQIA